MPESAGSASAANDATVTVEQNSSVGPRIDEAQDEWRRQVKAGKTASRFFDWYWDKYPAVRSDPTEQQRRRKIRQADVAQCQRVLDELVAEQSDMKAKAVQVAKVYDSKAREVEKMITAARKAVKDAEAALKEGGA